MAKPKIRFNGYTEDWEQRKLGEVIEGVSKKNANGLYTQDDILACSLGTELDRKTIFYGLRSTEDSVKSYRIVNIGNVIYTKSPIKGYPNGIVRTCKIVDGIVPSLYCVYKKKENISIPIDTRFIQSYLEDKGRLDQYLCPLVNVGARNNVNITDKEFLEGIIKIPTTVEEQAKIVDVLEKINHLITLHQRKCEQTKTLKKYMLQKMFPQDGEKVPQIRFEGFTEDWEQRKFGEIVEKYEDPVETPTEGYTRLGIRSHAKGTFHSYVEKGKELETAKMFRVAADKFIVNITFGWEHAVAITDENDAGKLVSHRFPQYSFNAGMEPKFFRYLILDENFKHHLELSSPGGAGRNRVLKLSDMLQYKMNFPSEAEQKKIAAYFDDLDHLITLHQRKCDELKEVKKFMLQNMFV